MSVDDKNHQPSNDESLVMHGLVSRIIGEARDGRSDKSILEVATQIKVDALNTLDLDLEINKKYIMACDTIIEFIKLNPGKTISDFYKDNK